MSTKTVKNEQPEQKEKSPKSRQKPRQNGVINQISKIISVSAQETDIKLEEIVNYCKDKNCRVKESA